MIRGPIGGLLPVVDPDLLENSIAMRAHCVDTDAEFVGDSDIAHAISDHQQNLAFAGAQKMPLLPAPSLPAPHIDKTGTHFLAGEPDLTTPDCLNTLG